MSKERITVDGQPFLGRIEEQERFREALRVVQQDRKLIARVIDWASETKPPLPFVFLLYGEGGMGKTYLTKRLRDIAQKEPQFKGNFNTIWLDWEKRRDLDYALKAPDAVSSEKVFEHIYSIFRDEGFGSNFTEYEDAVKTRLGTEEKIAKALEETSGRSERFKILRDLGGKGIAWLIRSGIVGGVSIPVPEEPTAKVFQEIIGGGADALVRTREAATRIVKATLSAREFDLFTLPNEKLAHSLADGIRKSTTDKPIILFLDTYEISDRTDVWVREVIKRSGQNVVWVIAGRNNLADSRKFGTKYFTGYRSEFPFDRLSVFPLSEFSVEDVFTYITDHVPDREINLDGAKAIHKATIGIPLAVQAATSIWQSGASIEDIIGNVPITAKRDEIVKLMTERFLSHCFDDPAHPNDLQNIYGLALAYQPDPDLLRAIFECEDLEKDLSNLERRHSFIFLNEMKLHSSVQAFLREYLSHRIRRSSVNVANIHKRANKYLVDELYEIENAGELSLGSLIENDTWKELNLGLIHHAFWLDPEDGWSVFIPVFVSGLLYNREFARACVEIIKNISNFLSKRERNRVSIIEKGINDFRNEGHFFTMLNRLENVSWSSRSKQKREEVSIYISLLQGQSLHQIGRYADALNIFEKVEKDLIEGNNKFNAVLGNSITEAATKFLETNPQQGKDFSLLKLIALLEKAIPLMQEKHKGFSTLGQAQIIIQRDDDAYISMMKAIEFNDNFGFAYYNLAIIERNKHHVEQAIEYCKQAIKREPNYEAAHNGLAYLYNQIGEFELAKQHLETVLISAQFQDPETHVNLGIAKYLLGQLDAAKEQFLAATENRREINMGTVGWIRVVTGEMQSGLKIIKDALNRNHFAYDIPNIVDWTMLISKSPNPPEGVAQLLELIENEPKFKQYWASKEYKEDKKSNK